jgi:FkbM family methyltransferase
MWGLSIVQHRKTIGVAPVKKQKIAFVLAATDHGTMILNRLDVQYREGDGYPFGVGGEILAYGSFEGGTGARIGQLIQARRKRFGDGVVVIDCGANIGVLTVEWAKMMQGWGSVIAIEAQERIFYALAGNVALNNCFNARVLNVAAGAENGVIDVSLPDYTMPANFGGLELRQNEKTEWIGQDLQRDGQSTQIKCITLDSLELPRVDLIKIDVEGMELEVLQGATKYMAMRPIVYVEHTKVGRDSLEAFFKQFGYGVFAQGMNTVAIHPEDPVFQDITVVK